MSNLFINRPIFAWVLAIMVMLAGIGSVLTLPVARYPDIAPVQINVRASYPGASAQTLETSVTQIMEQSLSGLDGLLYFQSQSTARGQAVINVIFAKGTNPDTAQVQVQNKINSIVSRLPQQVQQQGLRVTKASNDQLMFMVLYDETNRVSNRDLNDYLASHFQDPLSRVQGVGDTSGFGTQHAIRIWLNPQRLAAFSLMPSDVASAVSAQNAEVSAGEIGALPSLPGQVLNATVTAQGRLQTPEQFSEIVLKTLRDGSTVRVGDVARVEMGSEGYSSTNRIDGHPAAGVSIFLAPGADALKAAALAKAEVERLSRHLPDGLKVAYIADQTSVVKLSIHEVVISLIEAIILVVVVMFVFLQSWRATLIPAIAVPVVLLGTFAIFTLVGFTINTLTLFGLALAVGLLVDDAIVVVENVERIMRENPGMTPREATIRSMREIQVALVAIVLVLCAVFLPMAFFGGSTGVIYRQFSITIIAAMVLSVFVALILSPALTSSLLRAPPPDGPEEPSWIEQRLPGVGGRLAAARAGFNAGFERLRERYRGLVIVFVDRKWRLLGIYALLVLLLIVLFERLPTGFLPSEDQNITVLQARLPGGATTERMQSVQDTIERYVEKYEKANLRNVYAILGGGNAGGATGQNSAQIFLALRPAAERPGAENSADAIASRASAALKGLRDAQVFGTVPPVIRGLGSSTGFTMQLQNTGGLTHKDFLAAREKLVQMAAANPSLTSVRASDLPDAATMKVEVDPQRLTAYGLNSADVNNTLSTAWGGRYINDFDDNGRVKRVFIQADAQYRSTPDALGQWYVRSANGQMAPFSAFSRIGWSAAPVSLSRFSGVSAYEIQGQAGPGVSSGQAMDEIEKLASQLPGTSVAWSGASYEERLSSGRAPLLYAISTVVVFLCLAALYESWSIPVAVLLTVPLGLIGAVLAVTLRGLQNDVYLQIGLLTTMGLASKNAILMIEFAERAERQGMRVIDAALEAARIRLRPILMTSFAFIFGVLPLALAHGAGANSRVAIGTSVVGGMLSATLLAILYIPLFFVLVRRGVRDGIKALRCRFGPAPAGEAA